MRNRPRSACLSSCLLGENERFARRWLADYLAQVVDVDVPSLGTTRRAPHRLHRTLASLGRNVGQPSGWATFEVKLTGDQSVIDAAATGLTQFAAEIDQEQHGAPSALVVVTAVGGGGKRADGVHVVPITALGP